MCDKSMMDNYARWKQRATEDPDLLDELKSIAGRDEEILDRFYRELAFGTGGLRGVIAFTVTLNLPQRACGASLARGPTG